jgi:hypothetical protein
VTRTVRLTTCFPLLILGCLGCAGSDAVRDNDDTGLRFSDVTERSGITIETLCGDAQSKLAIPETLGQGAAVLDFDNDGRLDLFVPNGDVFEGTEAPFDPRPALYRNLGDLRFEDVTDRAGLNFRAWGVGVSRTDFDADGHSDLYVTVYAGPNRFFRNLGQGRFEAVEPLWGGADPGPSTASAFFDADMDGDLDLYVGNYVHYDPADPPNAGRPCIWRGLSVMCGPQGTPAAADTFYENREGRLVEATSAFGFAGVKPSYALGTLAGDLDDDGDVDLYVANDSEPNYVFENLGDGRFREVGVLRGGDRNEDGRSQAGMGVDLGDVDNDGRFDLFVTNFSHDTNTLYHSFRTPSGETVFEDVTTRTRLGLESYRYLSWGTRFIDLDRDGWQDIVLVSGHVYPQVDGAPVGTSYKQRNQIFLNRGAGTDGRVSFAEYEPNTGDAFEKQASSRGLVAADLDNDGDVDFLVVEMDARPTLIRNDSRGGGHWIGFGLRGSGDNVDAIGTRITVEDSHGVVRWRQRVAGSSYLSSGDPRLWVGLGPAVGPVSKVEVRWPSGTTAVYRDLQPDRYWLLDASTDTAQPL